MPSWDELFLEAKYREPVPEAEVYRFASLLERCFDDRPLHIWDLGCGAGRHTIAMAKLGHMVYGTDGAPNGVAAAERLLGELGLQGTVEVADMTECPWPEVEFHGVISWDVLQHNTLDMITKAVNGIYDRLVPGGMLLATIKSDKADLYGRGREIEPKTFVLDTSKEAGVPHHYFNKEELFELFSHRPWQHLAVTEQIIDNVIRPDRFWEYTPFRSTTWGVLMAKPKQSDVYQEQC